MSDELTPTDYSILLLLQIVDREISNTELAKLHDGVRLVSPTYEKLNALGYVVSNTERRPYRHRLSTEGAKLLGEPVLLADEQKRSGRDNLLWTTIVALHRKILGMPAVRATPPPARSLDERVRAAYHQVADQPGDWVDLTAIRPQLPDVAKGELDKALEKMLDAPDVRLDPEVHRHRIGKAEKEASVRIGGEDRHKLAIGLR